MQWAYALIAAEKLEEALEKLTDVISIRTKLLEKDNPDVLTTEYWIGTVYYYQNRPEDAECVLPLRSTSATRLTSSREYLRQAVEFQGGSGFGKPDLACARYRLALVLYDQHRRKEAVGLEEDAIMSIPEHDRPTVERRDDIIRLLDQRVFVQNGRSTGAFRGMRTGKE